MTNSYNGTGRRKEATARVYLKEGNGVLIVNNKPLGKYFYMDSCLQQLICQPLSLVSKEKGYDLFARVSGSGFHAQAEAIRLGISRALIKIDTEYKTILKSLGLTTRDPRTNERKKVGLVKARKRPPFVKR